ncbi:MAG: FAD-dependent oxidoreductase, partial [Proteobacteria bacterium]|nr:FAD-dependent oxidoreductase [Pseudomonadota bacterium]
MATIRPSTSYFTFGGGEPAYTSYAQRGGIPVVEENVAAVLELLPAFSSLRLMRQWAGITDITPDTMPIMGATPLRNLYMSGGWGTGGYKAIPAGGDTMAYTIANDAPHPLIKDFGLDRFERGALMLRIACPHCGTRDEVEFRCGGDAHIERPGSEVSDAVWADYLFNHDNPKGVILERWCHVFGCGQWCNVARD